MIFKGTKLGKLINYIQWKLLNVITLGQRETDNIIRTITINGYLYIVNYCYALQMGPMPLDHIKLLITLTMITLSG